MSGNFDDRESNAVDPYSPLEEILILSFKNCFDNETMVDTQILFAQHSEPIVRRGDRAIAMLLSDRSRDFALHQQVQNQVTYDARTLLLDCHKSFAVWGNIIHSNSFFCLKFAPRVRQRISSYCRIFSQFGATDLVVFQQIIEDLVWVVLGWRRLRKASYYNLSASLARQRNCRRDHIKDYKGY